MSQLTIKLSDKADALIAQLQKEIFNRRRKKVSASGVVETLVESGAKSQSDKRFATSWKNLISDIEKAAKLANAHGSKPANLTDAEWALVLSHRARAAAPAKPAARQASVAKPKPKASAPARNPIRKTKTAVKATKPAAKASAPRTASSAARRMAKAVSRLGSATPAPVAGSNGAAQPVSVS